jgi:hypothetical protein
LIVGGLNLGGSVALVHNPVEVMELAMETRVQSIFSLEAADALRMALNEG